MSRYESLLDSLGQTPLVAGLKPLAAFLRAHPDNVLLIDQEDYVTTDDAQAEPEGAHHNDDQEGYDEAAAESFPASDTPTNGAGTERAAAGS